MTGSVVQRQEIRSLTGLRGAAACFVVFYHSAKSGIMPGWVSHGIIEHGYISVDLFFLLSGFVMALSYGRLFSSTDLARAYPVFLLRRVARIYPLYLVVLLFAATQDVRHAIQHHSSLSGYAETLVANVFFLHGVGLSTSIIGPSWSVGAEFAAYLLLPILLLGSLNKARAGLCAILAYVLVVLVAYPPFGIKAIGISGPLDITSAYSVLPAIR